VKDSKKSKYLEAARSVFLRYGYKRANMSDIAQTAGISRAALYLVFRNKEEIFIGVLERWAEETIADVQKAVATGVTPREKLEQAFEIWAIRPYEIMTSSPEAKELIECSFDFAQASLRNAYKKFEATIAPIISVSASRPRGGVQLDAERTAHILASSVRGLKQTANTPVELRRLIEELLFLSLPYLAERTKKRA